MASYPKQDFYGSTVEGIIPQGWIDASTLREIPDHQELYLSPTTLSSMVVEINQAVPADEALRSLSTHQGQQEATAPRGGTPATPETIDKAAVQYHLQDLCDEGDTLQIVVPVKTVSLGGLRGVNKRAYSGVVAFTTPKKQRGGKVAQSVDGAAAGSSSEGLQRSMVSCHYLLVRLEEQETDLLVFFNVPHDEFAMQGDQSGLSREEELATGAIAKMVETLDIKDWGLFA